MSDQQGSDTPKKVLDASFTTESDTSLDGSLIVKSAPPTPLVKHGQEYPQDGTFVYGGVQRSESDSRLVFKPQLHVMADPVTPPTPPLQYVSPLIPSASVPAARTEEAGSNGISETV